MDTKKTTVVSKKKKKNLEEFDRAKKSIKKIGIISSAILMMLLAIGLFLVMKPSYAAITLRTAPETFTSSFTTEGVCNNPKELQLCQGVNYFGETNIQKGFVGKTDSLGDITNIFCIERRRNMESGKKYTKSDSVLSEYPGIIYILDNNKFSTTASDVAGEKYTQEELNQYLTQIAIWWYVDKKNNCDDTKNYTEKGSENQEPETDESSKFGGRDGAATYIYYNNLSAREKERIKTNADHVANAKLIQEVQDLVQKAMEYTPENQNPTVSVPDLSNLAYTVDKDYFITDNILLSSESKGFTYNVSVDKEDVKVLNSQGIEQKNGFSGSDSFRLKIPVTAFQNNKMTVNIDVSANFEVKNAYIYNPDSVGVDQKTVLGVIETKPKTARASLSYEIEVGEGIFRKVDPSTGEYVKDAIFVIKDQKGTQVSQFTTEDKDYVLTLPVGTYTLTETVIPDGYAAEQTTREFEIKKDGQTEVVIENTKKLDVPDTGIKTGWIYGIGALIVVVGIIIIVLTLKPENGRKKKD